MGRIVFVIINEMTGENKHYYHKLVRHYEDNILVSELNRNLTNILKCNLFILTNSRSMILSNFGTLYGNKVLCILQEWMFNSLKNNLVYVGCNDNIDYDSDDLESECCADMPDLEDIHGESSQEVF
jgi:hypothetical protein